MAASTQRKTALQLRGRKRNVTPQGKARARPLKASRVMQEQIVAGDIVRFKGGGSSMTVQKIERNEALCVFSLGGEQRLRLEVLEKASDEPHWWDQDRK